jgi:hypothetical protein
MTGLVDMLPGTRNSDRIDNSYLPKKPFYSGNGQLISGEALQILAEHLGDYRCMNFIRRAFADILNGLDMPDSDRAYYKWVAGAEE